MITSAHTELVTDRWTTRAFTSALLLETFLEVEMDFMMDFAILLFEHVTGEHNVGGLKNVRRQGKSMEKAAGGEVFAFGRGCLPRIPYF